MVCTGTVCEQVTAMFTCPGVLNSWIKVNGAYALGLISCTGRCSGFCIICYCCHLLTGQKSVHHCLLMTSALMLATYEHVVLVVLSAAWRTTAVAAK